LISELISTICSETPVQILSSAYNITHFLTLYLLHFLELHPVSNILLPERRMGTAWEPSERERKKFLATSKM
jgi:hypothetical protein